MPEVSVIIPFYNRIEWTKNAIASVIGQTFQDFEIILVDDGSDIDYRDEIEKLDERIVYVRQGNQGVSSARNTGIAFAKGKYIAFLDSDDSFLEMKLQKQVSVMNANPSILLSHTSYILTDRDGNENQTVDTSNFSGSVYPAILGNCPIATPTVMIRKDVSNFAKFLEDVHVAEDLLFWSKIAKRSEIIAMQEALTRVRLHGNNAVLNYDKQLAGLKNLVKYGINPDKDLSPGQKHKLFLEIYWQLGNVYRKKQQYIKSGACYFRALYYSLLEPDHGLWKHKASLVLRKILPESWRKNLKKVFLQFRANPGGKT